MAAAQAQRAHHPGNRDRSQRGEAVVGREQHADPVRALVVRGRAGVGGAEVQRGYRGRGVDPHAEQAEPGEELDHGELAHRGRHRVQVGGERGQDRPRYDARREQPQRAIGQRQRCQHIEHPVPGQRPDQPDAHDACQQPGHAAPGARDRRHCGFARALRFGVVERRQHLRRVLARGHDRPQHRQQQHRAAGVERPAHRVGHLAGRRGIGHAPLRQQPRQQAGDHRPDPDEEALHRVAGRTLARGQLVADEGAERFHRHVQRGVEDPQHAGGDPQLRRVRHREQRQGREDRAPQEVRPTATQSGPGAVGEVADHRLHQQAGQRGGNPKARHLLHLGAQGLEDPADVRVLQREPELDPQEPEAHVPDLPERQSRLGRHPDRTPHGDAGIVARSRAAVPAASPPPARRTATPRGAREPLFSGICAPRPCLLRPRNRPATAYVFIADGAPPGAAARARYGIVRATERSRPRWRCRRRRTGGVAR
ncbi:hypothetical protein L599_000300000710 [Luteimonas sp. J16]|nr:hypothetical protein L599_000300000710 [Luteimonas sp. J16]